MTENYLETGGPRSWSTTSDWDPEEARTVIVRLAPTMPDGGPRAEWRYTRPAPQARPGPAVEETWETASQLSLEREDHAGPDAFGNVGCSHPEVVLPTPSPTKKERAVRFAPTAPARRGWSCGLRLRRRGRLTNALEHVMKQSIGRWSDLSDTALSPAHAWLRGYGAGSLSKMSAGEDIVGWVKEEGKVPRRNAFPTVWLPFSTGAEAGNEGDVRALLVCPHLVAELTKRRMFRSVTSVLLGSLRGRSVMWADEEGISAMDLVKVMPGSIALSMLPMPDEVVALGALRGSAGRWSTQVLGALERGTLTGPSSLPLGNFLRGPLSWFFTRQDSRVLAPGVGTLTLPA